MSASNVRVLLATMAQATAVLQSTANAGNERALLEQVRYADTDDFAVWSAAAALGLWDNAGQVIAHASPADVVAALDGRRQA